jgi:hypothetical protein
MHRPSFAAVAGVVGAFVLGAFGARVAAQPPAAAARTEQKRDVGGFKGIDVSKAIVADIAVGQPFKLTVTADAAQLPFVETEVRDGTLHVGRKRGAPRQEGEVRVTIQLPALERLGLSGASRAAVTGLTGSADLDLSGASQARLLDVKGQTLKLDTSGASVVEATGSVAELNADISGASQARIKALAVKSARVDVSGASTLEITGQDSITGDASGASKVRVWGKPARLAVDTSGASSVKSMN